MSRPTIGAVVRCGDLVGGVFSAVANLLNGPVKADAMAIVADDSTPVAADAWLSAFADARGLRFLRLGTVEPGAVWNAGLDTVGPVDHGICLESGDVLDPSALDRLRRRVTSTDNAVIATSAIEWIGPGTQRSVSQPIGCSPVHILADPQGVHVSSLFRWSQWKEAGGFDEAMPALEFVDLWLRLLDSGGVVASDPAALLRRRVYGNALYRRLWAKSEYRRAARLLFDRHSHVVAANPGELLELKEQAVRLQSLRHQDGGRQLQGAEQEIKRLRARHAEVLDGAAHCRPSPDLGALARTAPISHDWGYDRGTPADRPLIEHFLKTHASDIRGSVLEIQEAEYTRQFGGSRVDRSDVLDIDTGNLRATTIGDLRGMDHIPPGSYDCIILTQTLHVIDDMRSVVRECERMLKPGGVLLATLPCASRVCLEYGPDGDQWRVTAAGARRIFADAFPPAALETTSLGNALVNAAFFYGLASEELPAGAYQSHDPYFPMVIGVRGRKPSTTHVGQTRTPAPPGTPGVALMYHRVGAHGIDPHRLSVAAATFRRQLDWLCNCCSVVPLDQLTCSGPSRPRRAVAVTFDDGYLDNLTVALPLLRAAGVPATFFVTTADGAFPFHYWWDRLAAMIVSPASAIGSLTIDLPSGRRDLAMSSESERRAAHWLVYEEIVRLPPAEREAVLQQIQERIGPPHLDESDRRMTCAEVLELASDGVCSIGAHTVDHLFLPAQSDSVLSSELRESRAALERLTDSTVDSLAYPFGAVDERTVAAARDAGFKLAVTCANGSITASHDPLTLPRVEVTEQPLDDFIARMEQAFTAAE